MSNPESKGRVLVVEDLESFREQLSQILKRGGYAVDTAKNIEEAHEPLDQNNYHLMTLDMNLRQDEDFGGGEELLFHIKHFHPTTLCIVISASVNEIEDAVSLITELGAVHFIRKGKLKVNKFLEKVDSSVRKSKEAEQALKAQRYT